MWPANESWLFLDYMCSFFNAKRWLVEHNRFYSRSVFFSNKITRASSYRCVYQYMGRSVGSKWLKEYLVYIVSVDLEVYTKFDLRYDRKIRVDRLSEHLSKSNFQKQRKRINPVVLYFEFWSHMALFWMTRRSFYAPLFLLSNKKNMVILIVCVAKWSSWWCMVLLFP